MHPVDSALEHTHRPRLAPTLVRKKSLVRGASSKRVHFGLQHNHVHPYEPDGQCLVSTRAHLAKERLEREQRRQGHFLDLFGEQVPLEEAEAHRRKVCYAKAQAAFEAAQRCAARDTAEAVMATLGLIRRKDKALFDATGWDAQQCDREEQDSKLLLLASLAK